MDLNMPWVDQPEVFKNLTNTLVVQKIDLLKQQFPWQQDTCDLQVNQWKPQYLKQHYVSLAMPGNNRYGDSMCVAGANL